MMVLTADLRYALFSLGRSRTFTATTLLTLTLVIGAGTAILSAISDLTFEPLPYPDSRQLVMLWDFNRRAGEEHVPVMEGAFPILLNETKASRESPRSVSLPPKRRSFPRSSGGPKNPFESRPTSQLFSLLRVAPILGRTFDPSETILWRTPPVVILSYSFWLRHYGGSRDVMGKTLDLNSFGVRVPCTIVGVMPAGLSFLTP